MGMVRRLLSWSPPAGVGRAGAVGLVLALGQIAFACLLSGQTNLHNAYASLYQWDGGWYRDIATQGYYTEQPFRIGHFGNVAFFPGYPLLGWALHRACGLDVVPALLLGAQLSAWVFWTYLWLLCRRWGVPPAVAAVGVIAVLCHPGAFFLVCSYSESLFLAGMLGFLYWSERPGRLAWVLAAAHGVVMTGTRLMGIPVVIAPLVRTWLDDGPRAAAGRVRRLAAAALLGACASLGMLGFYGYCQWRFGQWDLYEKSLAFGWSLHTDYLAIFSPRLFCTHWPHSDEGFIDPNFLSRLCVPTGLALCLGLAWVEWRTARTHPDSGWRQRLGIYLGAWLMFYIIICGRLSVQMDSVTRYAMCVQVLLALAVVHLLGRLGRLGVTPGRGVMRAACVWLLLSLAFGVAMTYRFTHGKWVA